MQRGAALRFPARRVSLIVSAASLCCYFPILFVLPITFGSNIIAYRKVFPERVMADDPRMNDEDAAFAESD